MIVVRLWCSECLYEWLCDVQDGLRVGVVVCGGVIDGMIDGYFSVFDLGRGAFRGYISELERIFELFE